MRRRLATAALVLCLAVPGLSALKKGSDAVSAATGPGTLVVTTLALTIGNPVMLVDGVRTALEAPPYVRGGRTLVPIRRVAEALGATVTYDTALRQVDVVRLDTSLSLVIGKPTAVLNGSVVPIDTADTRIVPVIANGRMMLPLRFVVESLGAIVMYNAASKIITIVWAYRDA
jgi:hypothetical protein